MRTGDQQPFDLRWPLVWASWAGPTSESSPNVPSQVKHQLASIGTVKPAGHAADYKWRNDARWKAYSDIPRTICYLA